MSESRARAAAAAQELVSERKKAAKMAVAQSRIMKELSEMAGMQARVGGGLAFVFCLLNHFYNS